MTAPNHIVGGFVITGLLGSFFNLNILASPLYIFATILGALIPDIDYTKSLIGKIFRPISKYLNRRFGHRTITHSLVAMFGSFLFLAFVESTFYHQTTFSKIYLIGFFSHLVLDMMTVQGVPLFYPFLRNPCVLPGNPNARFKTGNLYSETMIFCFFSICIIFLQPLFKNGFWTQYNRYFGTPKHLVSEFNKAEKALNVQYKIKKGTEIFTGSGICISAQENEIVLLEDGGFRRLNGKEMVILEVKPERTEFSLKFEKLDFFNISADSLNVLIQQFPIKKLNVFAPQDFFYFQNQFQYSARNLNLVYPDDLYFNVPKIDTSFVSFQFFPNPKIQTLSAEIQNLKSQENQFLLDKEKAQRYNNNLVHKFHTTENSAEKELLWQKIKDYKNQHKTNASIDFTTKIQTLQLRIKELKQSDYIRHQQEISKHKTTLQTPPIPKLSGNLVFIVLK